MSCKITFSDVVDLVYGRERSTTDKSSNNFDALARIELVVSNKLKKLCNKEGREVNKFESAKVIQYLGHVYRGRSPDKISLIKSAVLYQAALVRKPDNVEKIEEELGELCSHALELAGINSDAEILFDESKSFKEVVEDMRQMVRNVLEEMEEIPLHEYEEKEGQLKLIDVIEDVQQKIFDSYRIIMKRIMDFCVSLKKCIPCKFALVGMGSLSTKEITPYSDFEHLILLEEGVQSRDDYPEILECFRWISVLFQIFLVLLSETNIPSINLPFLNDPFKKSRNWFFDVHTKHGISFDGMKPYACKFPLGRSETRNRPWKTELIKPVSEMLTYLGEKEVLKNGYPLADVLTKTCFVSGCNEVYGAFELGVQKCMADGLYDTDMQNCFDENLKNFSPIESLDRMGKQKKWDLKHVVYRSTSLFISALGLFYKFNVNSSFDIIRELSVNHLVDENFAHELLFATAVACYFRLNIYNERGGRHDFMDSPENENEFGDILVQVIETKTTAMYFQTAMKLQRFTSKTIGRVKETYVQTSEDLDRLLVFFWLKQYEDAVFEAKRLSKKGNSKEIKNVNEVLLSIGHIYQNQQMYKKAIDCWQLAKSNWTKLQTNNVQQELAYCSEIIGNAKFHLGLQKEALESYDEAMKEATQGIAQKHNTSEKQQELHQR